MNYGIWNEAKIWIGWCRAPIIKSPSQGGDYWEFSHTCTNMQYTENVTVFETSSEVVKFSTIKEASLVPRPLPDFTSQPWRKIGRRSASKIRHRLEMVDSVSTNRVHITYWLSPPFPVCDVVLIPGLLLIFLHSCDTKSGSGLGTRLRGSLYQSIL